MDSTSVGLREFATGLQFPEGPIALEDGSLLVVEIARGTLTRVSKMGSLEVVAQLGGGPNGAALGPGGKCYVCNNGGISFRSVNGLMVPGLPPKEYSGGWIEVVNLSTGKSERLYEHCNGNKLSAPNDIVFDASGGFWFTDLGKTHRSRRQRDLGSLYYAKADGSLIEEIIFPLEGPNGVGLSPCGSIVYLSESTTGHLWSFELESTGKMKDYSRLPPWQRGRLHWSAGYYSMLDSLCVDESGFVYVADIPYGGVSIIAPSGQLEEQISTPDMLTTNICFGGLRHQTMFITLSSTGKLVYMEGKRKGLRLHWSSS